MIATNKGLGTALLITPPVLVLIAVGIAARSSVRVPPPVDHSPPHMSEPMSNITPVGKALSGIKSQLQQSLVDVEKKKDHADVVTIAMIAIGLIGAILTIKIIRQKGRGGGDRGGGKGRNATDFRYPDDTNSAHPGVHIQTGPMQDESLALNAGSGADPF